MTRLALTLLVAVAACKPAATPDPSPPEPAPAEDAPAPVDDGAADDQALAEPEPEPGPQRDEALDDAALLLAGLPLPEGSALAEFAATEHYQGYAARIDDAWARYDDETRSKVAAWSAEHLADLPAGPVFYPFSGPDILNAVIMLPQGTQYTLLGLEPVGVVPTPAGKDDEAVAASLARLEGSLIHILGRNYFITSSMKKDYAEQDAGVAAVMMFFLARTGHEILGVRDIELSAEGEPIERGGAVGTGVPARPAEGVEITFRVRGETGEGATKVVRFFSGNADDDHFTTYVGLPEHLEAQGELITLTKAASYLMYYPEFDDIRSIVLQRSRGIVTESSGLPFHYLEDGWDLSLYGTYDKPIKDYADRCQPDLKAALEQSSLGELPFHFTYQYRTADHLVVARRPADHPIAEASYDASNRKGDNTLCEDGKVRVSTINLR